MLAQDAQDAPDAKSKSVRISLLAIGDQPPIKFKDTNKGPVWIEPPKADFPPPLLYVKNKSKKNGGFDKLNLGLNTPMPPIEHPGGGIMRIFENKTDAITTEAEAAAKECYLAVPLPDEKVDLTVFLVRDPGSKSWRKTPKSFAFKSDPVTFPPDCVRVINFSSHPMRGKVTGVLFDLGPAGSPSCVKVIPASCENRVLTYQMGSVIKGKPVILADTATSFYSGSRMNMVIYHGDGVDSDGSLKYCTFFEPLARKEPVPKKETAPNPASAPETSSGDG